MKFLFSIVLLDRYAVSLLVTTNVLSNKKSFGILAGFYILLSLVIFYIAKWKDLLYIRRRETMAFLLFFSNHFLN